MISYSVLGEGEGAIEVQDRASNCTSESFPSHYRPFNSVENDRKFTKSDIPLASCIVRSAVSGRATVYLSTIGRGESHCPPQYRCHHVQYLDLAEEVCPSLFIQHRKMNLYCDS